MLAVLLDSGPAMNSSTAITIGASASVVLAVLGIYKYLRDNFELLRSERKDDFSALRRDIDRIFNRLDTMEGARSETWTLADMRFWELELRRMNPTLSAPDALRISTERIERTDR